MCGGCLLQSWKELDGVGYRDFSIRQWWDDGVRSRGLQSVQLRHGNGHRTIDLTGNGLRFSGLEQGIVFDVNGYDHIFRLGWPVGKDDGWIVLDRNLNGRIDDGSEMFGNATRLADGTIARNGFYALAELDASGDGYIDASDPAFGQLRVWLDSDRNGNSEPGELRSLASLGVARLSTNYWESMSIDRHGNRFLYRSQAEMSDGSTRPLVDAFPVFELLSRPPCTSPNAPVGSEVRP